MRMILPATFFITAPTNSSLSNKFILPPIFPWGNMKVSVKITGREVQVICGI